MKKTHEDLSKRTAEEEEDEEEEEDDDDDDEEDESEEEEEEPPQLSYVSYYKESADIKSIFQNDAASALAVHVRFLAMGTHMGFLYILDFNGNQIKQFKSHETTVNELSIDNKGDYVASCSNDGRVIIYGLYNNEKVQYDFDRPVRCVALDPKYAVKNTKPCASGGKAGKLVLNSKGWFNKKDIVIHQGEGPIHAVKWRGNFIAWANNLGVKVYDVEAQQIITYIDRGATEYRPDLYRCSLVWQDDSTLIIGWAKSIKIARIRQRPEAERIAAANLNGIKLPAHFMEITSMFDSEYFVCGVAPYNDNLLVLSYEDQDLESEASPTNSNSSNATSPSPVKNRISPRPQVQIVTRDGEELSSDALSVRGFEKYFATDYRLEYFGSDNNFFIVSPNDIVLIKQRGWDDTLDWLLERKRYAEALDCARSHQRELQKYTVLEIGEKYLGHLLDSGKYEEAAELCPSILGKDPKGWEKWIFIFGKNLKYIIKYIPISDPQLDPTVYEMVLKYWLDTNHAEFLRSIREWPHKIYDVNNIITAINDKLKQPPNVDSEILQNALAELYAFDNQLDKTLMMYLKLKRQDTFEFIDKHKLIDKVQDKVLELMNFDTKRAIALLINNIERIPIPQVVSQLSVNRYYQHLYLDALFRKDVIIAKDYHELQVELYAEFDKQALLSFLKSSNYYPLEKAYQICEKNKIYEGMVFVLGRMGNTKDALTLLIEELGDVEQAITFVKDQNDEELWEDLINYSLSNASFVSDLLDHIGEHIDPLKLIKQIPPNMQIHKTERSKFELKEKLVRVISEYALQANLNANCLDLLRSDTVTLSHQLFKMRRRGVRVDPGTAAATTAPGSTAAIRSSSQRCEVCGEPPVAGRRKDMVVFWSGQVYHPTCFEHTFPTRLPQTLSVARLKQQNQQQGSYD